MNVRGYLEDPRCDVVAVCDTDEEVGRQAAKEWGAESFYADLSDMLADDSIDAVEVLTPTHLHHDHVIAALEAGKHVSVQKPVANSVEDALEMQAVAERVGRTLRISECFVHYPPLELAKRLVADGAIGKPTSLRIRTLVGQTDSAFQAGAAPRGLRLAPRQAEPGRAPLRRHGAQVRHGAVAARPRHHLGAGGRSSARPLLRAVRRDLRVRGPRRARHDGGPVRAELLHALAYYGADEFFEITGDEGQIWVTRATGEMLDLAPVMLFTGTPQETQDHRVHRPRRRLGHRLRALLTALRRRAAARDARPP